MSEETPALDSDRESVPFQVLLYYLYLPIEDPESYVEDHRELCESLGLFGRILIAREGINGTVSGPVDSCEAYMAHLKKETDGRMDFKVDPAPGHAFAKLSVKARSEIVSLGLSGGEDVDPNETTGTYLGPRAFFEAMQDPEVVVFDGRNQYESDLGRFRGALCPPLEHFRDFPEWIRKNMSHLKDKKILTYCTGGIRCEKLSGFLKQEGFKDVYQLEGGIVTYGKDEAVQGRDFEGQCYVFDQRIGVEVNRANPGVVATCSYCQSPCERYRNCGYAPCNRQYFICPQCEEQKGNYCCAECQAEKEKA